MILESMWVCEKLVKLGQLSVCILMVSSEFKWTTVTFQFDINIYCATKFSPSAMGQQRAGCCIYGCCTWFPTAWRMVLCRWHGAAGLGLHRFLHITPLVWVISERKCSMITAKAFCFTTLFLFLMPCISTPKPLPSPGWTPHKPLSQAAGHQPRSLTICPKHCAPAWVPYQPPSCCSPPGYWCCWSNLVCLWCLLSCCPIPCSTSGLGQGFESTRWNYSSIWVGLRVQKEEKHPLEKTKQNKTLGISRNILL